MEMGKRKKRSRKILCKLRRKKVPQMAQGDRQEEEEREEGGERECS